MSGDLLSGEVSPAFEIVSKADMAISPCKRDVFRMLWPSCRSLLLRNWAVFPVDQLTLRPHCTYGNVLCQLNRFSQLKTYVAVLTQ